ncbi:hypothetical protein EBU95_20990 [bacterium]|nr:hypothetical protein [bacterium]
MKVLITGFPKSGTTWLCRILDCLLNKEYKISKQMSQNIKRIYVSKDHTIIFSYLNNPLYTTNFDVPNHDKCIILYRDFKDIIVSCYFQQKHRETTNYSGTISEFIDFDYGGIKSIINFYKTIEEQGKDKEYLYYEKMAESIKSLSIFDKTKLDTCLELNSFENMRQQEIVNYSKAQITDSDSIELCPKDINNIDSYKTRSGKVGNYVNYLSKEDIEKIDNCLVIN